MARQNQTGKWGEAVVAEKLRELSFDVIPASHNGKYDLTI